MAVYRKTALEHLAFRIQSLGGGNGRGRGGANEAASKPRKLAWDIVNKIVWKRQRSSSERGTRGEDPVLPRSISLGSLGSRLRSAFSQATLSDKDIASLERDFARRAADLCAFAERQQLLWRQRGEFGRPISDRLLGVTCSAHPTDSKLCQLHLSDQGEIVETVELWRTHVETLKALHRVRRQRAAATAPPGSQDDHLEAGLVYTRIFTMALRYDSLSGCKCAYQAALPPPVMELLKSELGCAHECFASPLNQYLGSFCSAFPGEA